MGGYLKRIEFILSGLTQIRCGSILNICTLALPRVSWDQSVCRPLLSIRVTPPPPYSATQYLQYPKYSHNIRVTPSPLYSVTTPPLYPTDSAPNHFLWKAAGLTRGEITDNHYPHPGRRRQYIAGCHPIPTQGSPKRSLSLAARRLFTKKISGKIFRGV